MKESVKKITKTLFGEKIQGRLNTLYKNFKGFYYKNNLNKLAELYNSDKYGYHFYTENYMKLFLPIREQKLKILEIGIGGFEDPEAGGASLLMWQKFFPNSDIYGLDLYDKSKLNSNRIKTFKGSQVDKSFLTDILNTTGGLDIIIDDGSHVPVHQIESFKFLFPYLNCNGFYIVEDTLSSYNQYYKETSGTNGSFLDFAKDLTDFVNYRNNSLHLKEFYQAIKSKLDNNGLSSIIGELEFVSFYEQLTIVKKR